MSKRQFKTESKKILDLMINSIYTHREIFLRELISNASDAIDKLCYKSLTEEGVELDRSDFAITITVNEDKRTITISDNGIGMTAEELENNLGVIARSGSSAFSAAMDKSKDEELDIIGQFGVGFYSAFMVADKVTVLTRSYGAESANKWTSSGADGYTITEAQKDSFGTDITLHLKADPEEEQGEYTDYLKSYRLRSLIKKYSDYIRWPIRLDGETVNSQIPIWQRTKAEATDEDCIKYYKEKYHDDKDPVCVIRVNAEGAVSYRALLFVPAAAAYDYYTVNYQAGPELYSNGVMIMEHCADLLPEFFRFVRGVVDSPDLSLNISRELLQHDKQLKIIGSNLEKRVKNELKKLLENDREKYEQFYLSFGMDLRFGILRDYGLKKDLLTDLLLFYSDKNDKNVTLKEYFDAMPEAQKNIYYASGESVEAAASRPQLEPVRDCGYDILLLGDTSGDMLMRMVNEYESKPIKSVNDDDLGLDEGQRHEAAAQASEDNRELLDWIKEQLDGKVEEVRVSERLTSYPVCLTAKGPVSLDMEKYFSNIPGETAGIRAQRVLELNADHSVFEALKNAFDNDQSKAKNYVEVLYTLAELLAGFMPQQPAEFSEQVSSLII